MSKKQFDVNYWGVLSTTQQFFPLLRNGKGTIVNIGSAVNLVPGPYTSSYRSTKAAVEVLSHAMRAEMEPFGLHVVHVRSPFHLHLSSLWAKNERR
jgi:short-subunit dehydrogenase